jgi:hypothetical protein
MELSRRRYSKHIIDACEVLYDRNIDMSESMRTISNRDGGGIVVPKSHNDWVKNRLNSQPQQSYSGNTSGDRCRTSFGVCSLPVSGRVGAYCICTGPQGIDPGTVIP